MLQAWNFPNQKINVAAATGSIMKLDRQSTQYEGSIQCIKPIFSLFSTLLHTTYPIFWRDGIGKMREKNTTNESKVFHLSKTANIHDIPKVWIKSCNTVSTTGKLKKFRKYREIMKKLENWGHFPEKSWKIIIKTCFRIICEIWHLENLSSYFWRFFSFPSLLNE